jgi:ATP-dependent Lhr-like helicase
MSQEAFSLLHPGVQEAVWKMGWKEFKPIQVQAIHAICETKNHLVICAPTAGGKTEAAFLPIISQLAANPQPSVQAIYIGPLKALINDQFQRLEELCAKLEIPVHRWHGDVPANQKKALRDKPSGILLITPESLESNFINFGLQVPRVYQHLSFVVIDELHSFFGNERGVHLQSLLSRLQNIAACRPRLVGLSATLANPKSARAFLAPDAVESVQVIEDTSAKREIKFGIRTFLKCPPEREIPAPRLTPEQSLALVSSLTAQAVGSEKELAVLIQQRTEPATPNTAKSEDALDEIADDIIQNFQLSTNLIFGNAKGAIEELADKLHERVLREKWPADPFVVHHGSLSKDLREDAEAALKSGVPTTALCSSTLEMGIDIGNVRAIGQIDTPWSVSSMVQRLGRSGRREGEPAIMRLYVRENSPHSRSTLTDLLFPDLIRAIAMTRLMLEKWLEPFDQNRMHVSTLTHQILSHLKQTGGMPATDLFRALC